MGTEGSATAAVYATEFSGVVERAFPVDDAAIARVRAAALGAFITEAPTSRQRTVGRLGGRPARGFARRGMAIGLAATVGLLAFSAVAVEARPGGTFYQVRLAIENATLASADVPGGWQARLDRLQRRIDEALAAAHDADANAVAAVLGEYRSELTGMTAGLADPGRRASLGAVVAGDLIVVLDLERTYPSEVAGLLVADIRAFLGLTDPGAPDDKGGAAATPDSGRSTRDPSDGPSSDPRHNGAVGNPHADGTTGNPHADGATGNPHADGATGNPHADGTKGNPHDGKTGNPHADGKTGNPHSGTQKPGKPHGP